MLWQHKCFRSDPRQSNDTAVVGADPEPVFAVHEKRDNARYAGCGIHAFKRIAVITDQTAVAANPDKALLRLHDGVGFGGRKAVLVII